ncbi:MAG: hypothetical protein FWH29_04730 [Methanobrevibacter sp.]|nr:hypothetical protein [Methanobrevibacter sp.]
MNLTFEQILEYFFYKLKDDYHKTVAEISISTNNIPFIENYSKIFSMDDMCEYVCEKKTKSNYSSTDGIDCKKRYNGGFKIYIIEFKRFDLAKKSEKEIFDNFLEKLKKENEKLYNEYNKKLNYIKSHFNIEKSHDLRLKPLETIFCIIPHLLELHNHGYNVDEVMNFLLYDCELIYIIVSNIYDTIPKRSRTSRHRSLSSSFKSVENLVPHVFNKIERFNEIQFEKFVENTYYSKYLNYFIKKETRKFVEDISECEDLSILPILL